MAMLREPGKAEEGPKDEENVAIHVPLTVSDLAGVQSDGSPRKTATTITMSNLMRGSKLSNRSTRKTVDRDEYSYQGIVLPADPSKRFLTNGEQDIRIIRDPVPLLDRQLYIPKQSETHIEELRTNIYARDMTKKNQKREAETIKKQKAEVMQAFTPGSLTKLIANKKGLVTDYQGKPIKIKEVIQTAAPVGLGETLSKVGDPAVTSETARYILKRHFGRQDTDEAITDYETNKREAAKKDKSPSYLGNGLARQRSKEPAEPTIIDLAYKKLKEVRKQSVGRPSISLKIKRSPVITSEHFGSRAVFALVEHEIDACIEVLKSYLTKSWKEPSGVTVQRVKAIYYEVMQDESAPQHLPQDYVLGAEASVSLDKEEGTSKRDSNQRLSPVSSPKSGRASDKDPQHSASRLKSATVKVPVEVQEALTLLSQYFLVSQNRRKHVKKVQELAKLLKIGLEKQALGDLIHPLLKQLDDRRDSSQMIELRVNNPLASNRSIDAHSVSKLQASGETVQRNQSVGHISGYLFEKSNLSLPDGANNKMSKLLEKKVKAKMKELGITLADGVEGAPGTSRTDGKLSSERQGGVAKPSGASAISKPQAQKSSGLKQGDSSKNPNHPSSVAQRSNTSGGLRVALDIPEQIVTSIEIGATVTGTSGGPPNYGSQINPSSNQAQSALRRILRPNTTRQPESVRERRPTLPKRNSFFSLIERSRELSRERTRATSSSVQLEALEESKLNGSRSRSMKAETHLEEQHVILRGPSYALLFEDYSSQPGGSSRRGKAGPAAVQPEVPRIPLPQLKK